MESRSEGNYLLYLGRIHPKKAIDNLLKALALSDVFLKSCLVLKIAGKGKPDYERKLKRLATDLKLDGKICFVGQVEGSEKSRLLADARFTVMPSHTENFGVVVLESLAQGTPVIASRNSPWATLEIEKAGFWTGNSPDELAAAIDKALEMESADYEAYREQSRNYVLRAFDIRNHIHKWVDFYQRFL